MLLAMQVSGGQHESPIEALSAFVRDARARSGFSLHDIQRRGGPAPSLLSDLENGKKLEVPKPSTLAKLAKGLGVPLDDVYRVAGLLRHDQSLIAQTTGQEKTRKPWPLHDSSQTSEKTAETLKGATGNELSTLSLNTGETDTGMVNLGGRTGEPGHIQMFPAHLGPMVRLPVFRVSCGERILNNEQPEEWQAWPVSMVGSVDGTLIVEGNSMIGAGIGPGDQIFFQVINGHRPQSGNTVVAEVNGATVCKIYQRGSDGTEFLVSAPEDEDKKFFALVNESVRLVGIVKKHLRNI